MKDKSKLVLLLMIMLSLGLTACLGKVTPKEVTPISEIEVPEDTYPLEDPSLGPPQPVYSPDGCAVSYDPLINYFPGQATVDYAQGFSIEYHNNYKILTVTQPWANAQQAFSYVLVQCGTPAPEGLSGIPIFEVPIRSIVTMSATYLPYLEQFGELDSIIGVDDLTYIYNGNVQKLAAEGRITVVGGGAGGGVASVETLIELEPDVIMTSASGYADYDAHPKLLEAGLAVVINGDYVENTPLGRAEWGKFIAAFYNLEAEADAKFDEMVERYLGLTSLTRDLIQKPTVFTNTDYQGSWYVPSGQSYAAILLQDAGAEYLWSDIEGTGATPLSFEQVYEKAITADFWLNVGFASDLGSLMAMDERYADFAAINSGNVYNYVARVNPSGGSDYFESGAANPDIVLADLIRIFHPELLPDHTLNYYKQLQ
jgi:iron complex transport system substrate-binding protein